MPSETYQPQADVAKMMRIFGQEVRSTPRMIEDPKERMLAGNLILEECDEFFAALGLSIAVDKETEEPFLYHDRDAPLNLVEAADAIGDMLVVVYGAANRLGLNAQAIFDEVHRSNMSKTNPDGTVTRRESDGKVIKPDTYSPANIRAVLGLSK